MMAIGMLMFLFFTFLGIEEAMINPINAFVLFVIAFVYLRGFQKGKSYIYTASLIAAIFASISILTILASYADSLLLGEEFELSFEWSLLGVFALPILWKLKP
ncbi:hypothetical protein DRP07_11555 [Archaeoglobales archaeon]|nr:MAG: hypothetical protein DRP07_11555 [Archaeoglobales archaeon]